eukprot:TRINITY_DN907_c0_g1_i2.p1 TRINITY_DN907_c0_g1~~TRINITY_DN907_c0_g1_i2.p1  ORF type:complete len:189 (-),score=47.66 TRINITY_DN907_c0_g1_i2:134-700(-)
MKYVDGIIILLVSIISALVCEGISWLLIYRTPSYRNLRSSIDRTSRRVDAMKGKGGTAAALARGKRAKKIDRFESSLKDANKTLSMSKFQSGAVVGVTLLLVFGVLTSLFDGKPVAKLPFTPFKFIQNMSHRGLPGDDGTDCAMVFLYMLCSLCIRPNLQKLLGFSPPRAAGAQQNNIFGLTDPAKQK